MSLIARLEGLRSEYGRRASALKLEVLSALDRTELKSADAVLRLHETLCLFRAYPDDARVLGRVERMLSTFDRRADLARHRTRLADTGIAGTEIHFRFFHPMADWLARHWPDRLALEWSELDDHALLERLLPLLVHFAATPALDEYALEPRDWIQRARGRGQTDAAFLIEAFRRLRVDGLAREMLYDQLDVPMVLRPGPGTPSRTLARGPRTRVVFQRRPLARARPDLAQELARRPRSIAPVSLPQGQKLIDLARVSMVTRQRDLDVFSHGDPADVRLVDCGGGYQLACIGAVPERRLLLESVYGYLTLKNGVPIGYVLTAALFGSAEIAYNVFETFRGAEARPVYGRVLAATRALFGAESFTIPPYQLGVGNDEAIGSGAWWFYRKLGFAPLDPRTKRLTRSEERALRADPSHRSSPRTLGRLAQAPLFFHAGKPRRDVLGALSLPNVGLHVLRYVSERFGGDHERATAVCEGETASLLGIAPLDKLPPGERLALQRWGPLVLILPGIARWTAAERRACGAVIRAKGGRRESDFVLAFDRHRKLRQAIQRLAAREPERRGG